MDCEKIRDRFSSLWEKELAPFEEEIMKEHLSSCPECRREFEQFEKTMGWLHSVGEAEVPEGFLSELYKKREGKKGAIPFEKPGGGWFHFPLSFKLPAQAVAMVVVVFLVLYLTKMMPMEGGRLNETKQTSAPLSLQEKQEQVFTGSQAPSPSAGGEGKDRRSDSTLNEFSPSTRQAYRPEQSQGAGRRGERLSPREEERKSPGISQETPRAIDSERAKSAVEPPPPTAEIMAYRQMESKGAAKDKTPPPPPEPGKMKEEPAVRQKSLVATKPPEEIILKVSDRKKVIPRLQELVKEFGGEVVTAEENMFLASLPAGSVPRFEKELAGWSSPAKADLLKAKKEAAGSLGLEKETKGKEAGERSKGPSGVGVDTGSRTVVRILLVEE